ncbi:MAG: DUF2142 domain-containing protein [Clostridia bacterium]|nr:DUF2142 domain-containing protein [Clostridia bacterium]
MEKIKENLRKDWKFFSALIIAIIALLMIAFYALGVSDKLYRKSEKITTEDYIQNIEEGNKIEQKIRAKENNFQRIDIEFEPLKEQIEVAGKVRISIQDEKGEIIKEETITRNNIRENSKYEFSFRNQSQSEGKEYILSLQFAEIEEGKKFFSVKIADSQENQITVNGQNQQGQLAIQEVYLSRTKQAVFIGIATLITIYVIAISTYIYYKKNIKVEKIFLYTVPVICLFYILCMPTFKNHDELYHWFRGYEVSIGKFMTGIDGDTLGTKMPENIVEPLTQDWTKITYADVKQYLSLGLEPEKETVLYAETSAVYSFIQYLPQGIGIFVTRLFTDKVLLLAYGGRMMNMIVSLGCIYLAIKKIPFGKKILLLMSYIPIAIEGFSSLSPDAMTISVAFLYIAYILSLAFHKKDSIIGKKQMVILTILSVIMALCKIVYIPFILLMFLIPKEKFKKEKKVKTIIIIIAIACIVNLIWLGISSIYLAHFREGDSSVQVKSIFRNPIKYLQNCLYTLDLNGDSYIFTMFGGKLGWGELIKVNSIVPYTLFILTIWLTLADKTIKDKFKLDQKVILFLTILAIGGLIFTSLYVQWTTCGSDSIAGIQGRYFIPILPLAMLLIGSQIKLKTEYKDKSIRKSIGIIGTMLQIIVVLQITICHL